MNDLIPGIPGQPGPPNSTLVSFDHGIPMYRANAVQGEGDFQREAAALWDTLGRGLGQVPDLARRGVAAAGRGIDALDRGTDSLGRVASVLGASPETSALIGDPGDAALNAVTPDTFRNFMDRYAGMSAGFPGMTQQEVQADFGGAGAPVGGAPIGLGAPGAPGGVGSPGGGFSAQLGSGYNPPAITYDRPDAPNYDAVKKSLQELALGAWPTGPTAWDLTAASLAGAAGGAAGGDPSNVGGILARAGAGAYAGREAKEAAFTAELAAYEERYTKLEMDRNTALANIEKAQGDFRQSVAKDSLEADIANANQQIALMQLSKPQSDIVGGYLVVNQFDPRTGKLAVSRFMVNPLIEEIAMMTAMSRNNRYEGRNADVLTMPMPGGGNFSIKNPGMAAHFMGAMMEAETNPKDPRVLQAYQLAAESAFPGLETEDAMAEAEILRQRDIVAFDKLIKAQQILILVTDGINQGREIPQGGPPK